MVKVTVKNFAAISFSGAREITLYVPEKIEEAIGQLLAGPAVELKAGFGNEHHLLINGRNYTFVLKEKKELKEGDVLTFVSMTFGG